MNVHDPELLNLQETKQSVMLPDLLPRISASLDPQCPHLPEPFGWQLFVLKTYENICGNNQFGFGFFISWTMDSLFVDLYTI